MEITKEKKKIALEAILLISIIALAIVGLWFLAEHIRGMDEVEPIDSPIKVSLRIMEGGWIIEYLDIQTLNNTVFKLLIESSLAYNFSVDYTYWHGYESMFVNSINGTHNGDDNLWWQYYVNDAYGEIGCDKKEIFHGDVVEWRFEEPGQ